MKKFLIVMGALGSISLSAVAADIGVSVSIGQPGFYGQIDIGGFPPPVLLYEQPVIIERVAVSRPPIYLHVPPGHAKNWAKNCRKYGACGERVYFVKDDWYAREYVPRYQERRVDYRNDNRNEYRGKSKKDKRGDDRNKSRGAKRDD